MIFKRVLGLLLIIFSILTLTPVLAQETVKPHVEYAVHVENKGWQDPVKDGTTAGTTGENLRQEAVKIKIVDDNGKPVSGLGVSYRSHVQDEGWQSFVKDGTESGTTGQSKKVEAIQISLVGKKADEYNIAYRTHVENYGWTGWTSDGEPSGSEGFNLRMEGIEIKLLPKDESQNLDFSDEAFYSRYGSGLVRYNVHVENEGWQNFKNDNEEAGTTGQYLKIEALTVSPNPNLPEGEILISPYIQDIGWTDYVPSFQVAGTDGQNLRLEAFKAKLTGELAKTYDISYQAHVQDDGWQEPVKNDEIAGTTDQSKRIEAIRINLIPKKEILFEDFAKQAAQLIKDNPIPDEQKTTKDSLYKTGRLIVQLKSGELDFSTYKVKDSAQYDHLYLLQFADASAAESAKLKIEKIGNVAYVEPDGVFEDNSILQTDEAEQSIPVQEPESDAFTSWGEERIGATEFADYLVNNGLAAREIKVAVIDTGIKSQPYLNDRILPGYDYYNLDEDPEDNAGHGTHIAGTIVSCTPGLNVQIVPLKITDNNAVNPHYNEFNLGAAIREAVNEGCKVINLSLGGLSSETSHNFVDESIKYALNKGSLVCIASGNSNGDTELICPAHLNNNSLVVGATANNEENSRWTDSENENVGSNFGASLDLVAPGKEIASCGIGEDLTPAVYTGTSMATSHVTAAAALLYVRNPSSSPKYIQKALKNSALDLGKEGRDDEYGSGLVNLYDFINEDPVSDTGVI